jgi:hypothetical protein
MSISMSPLFLGTYGSYLLLPPRFLYTRPMMFVVVAIHYFLNLAQQWKAD